jgi:hypothetical protein
MCVGTELTEDANLPDHLLRNSAIIRAACNGLVTGFGDCDEG